MELADRIEKFNKEIQAVGGAIYTKEMLRRFQSYWSEPNRAKKVRMRFELERTWSLERRLAKWANSNYDGIECFLTDSQKTIAEKKKYFIDQLQPYRKIYSREILNSFFRKWGQAENVPNPKRLMWEAEPFWEIGTRLASYADRFQNQTSNFR